MNTNKNKEEDQTSEFYPMENKRSSFDNQFKDHDVVYEEFESKILGKVIQWRWAKPGTHTHSCNFLIQQGCLIVTGDYGEATYNWYSRDLSPLFLSNCHEHYIHSKCTSSAEGRIFSSWNDNIFKKWLEKQKKRVVSEAIQEGYLYRNKYNCAEKIKWNEDEESEEQFVNKITMLVNKDYEELNDIYNQEDWISFLRSEGERFFGSDWTEYTADAGEGPDISFICQMECLKRSIEKLKEKNYV